MKGNRGASGFSMVELMLVVLLIGVLVTIAIPTYVRAEARAASQTCFANQRLLEGLAVTWFADNEDGSLDELVGTIDSDHPVVADGLLKSPARCPSAPEPANPANPTPAEGAYLFDDAGSILACPFGDEGVHGHY